jgi:hypothetical protein
VQNLEAIVAAIWYEFNRLWRERFMFRWTLANTLGWSAGLLMGATTSSTLGGLPGVFLGGIICGAIAGWGQFLALRGFDLDIDRRWIVLSAIGGGLAIIPTGIAAIALFVGARFGLAIMGATFGLCMGLMQSAAFAFPEDAIVMWGLANLLAGSLCSVFTLTGVPFNLPVICTLGPVTFGTITGFALIKIVRESEI